MWEIRGKESAVLFLKRVLTHLDESTFSQWVGSELGTFGEWFKAIEDARNIVKEAIKEVEYVPTPLEKSVVGIVDTSEVTIVVIDTDKLEREVLKGSIADAEVGGLLPFKTVPVGGENYIHIANASAYIVETNSHQVPYGKTLCAKDGQTYYVTEPRTATCPGCLAKAKTIIVNHLLTNPNLIPA